MKVNEVMDFPGGSDGKESACSSGDLPWVRKSPWRREWQHTPVFMPGESHGGLVGSMGLQRV